MQIKNEMQQLGKSQNFPRCNAQFEGGAKSLEKQQSRQRSQHANQVCVCVCTCATAQSRIPNRISPKGATDKLSSENTERREGKGGAPL